MHPHLHNEAALACRDIIGALEECHAKGFLWKTMGNCSALKEQVNQCLRDERGRRATNNRSDARINSAEWKKKAKELGLD